MGIIPRISRPTKLIIKQAWLSLSSTDYYQDVLKVYKGSGLNYFFTMTFIASLLHCASLLSNLTNAKDYFSSNLINSRIANKIDFAIKQLPDIHYSGQDITTDSEDPEYIYDEKGNIIAAIDTNNKLSYGEMLKLPIILSKNAIKLSSLDMGGANRNLSSVSYSKFLDSEPKLFTQEEIKKHFSEALANVHNIFIFILTPMIVAIFFAAKLLGSIFVVSLLYFFMIFLGFRVPMRTCLRLALFAAGAPVLIQSFSELYLPSLAFIFKFSNIWTNILMFSGIAKLKLSEKSGNN